MKALEKQIQLELTTGKYTEIDVGYPCTVKQYFASLTVLNKSSHIYGVVYLATDDALKELE